MTLRKYLFSIALLFLIPAVALASMGNGLAWAFGIIAGMLTVGTLAMDETLPRAEQEELDRQIEESFRQATDPAEPGSINYQG